MATTVELHPNIGSVWQRGLALWDLYATGTYTAWSYAFNGSYDNRAWDIYVTNPDTSVDTFTLISGEIDNGGYAALEYLSQNPGFHATLKSVYPDPLPDGNHPWVKYRTGPWGWRGSIWSIVCSGNQDLLNYDDTGTRYGITNHFIFCAYTKNLNVVIDGTGIMWGTPTVNLVVGPPSNYYGASPIAIGAAGGGGAAPDLGPLTEAVLSIADKEVDWKGNEGGSTWSLYSKVVAE